MIRCRGRLGGITQLGILLYLLWALAQPIDHVAIETPAGRATNSEPFEIIIRAIAQDGLAATNWQGILELFASRPAPAMPAITEIYKTGAAIEIANPTDETIDLSGWELEALSDYPYYGGSATPPNARLRFPSGTQLKPYRRTDVVRKRTSTGDFSRLCQCEAPFNSIRLLSRALARCQRNHCG